MKRADVVVNRAQHSAVFDSETCGHAFRAGSETRAQHCGLAVSGRVRSTGAERKGTRADFRVGAGCRSDHWRVTSFTSPGPPFARVGRVCGGIGLPGARSLGSLAGDALHLPGPLSKEGEIWRSIRGGKSPLLLLRVFNSPASSRPFSDRLLAFAGAIAPGGVDSFVSRRISRA